MAHLDPSRTALQLDQLELTAATLLGGGAADDPFLSTDDGRAAVTSLERAGVVQDGRVGGYPARMLAILADPRLRVMVEKYGAERPLREFGAARDAYAVWAKPLDGGTTEFTPVEPELIPWEVARAVGLGARPEPVATADLRVSAAAFEASIEHLRDGDLAGASERLRDDAYTAEGQESLIVQVLLDRRLSWRAFSLWHDENDREMFASVSTIDGGESGYWFSEHEPAQEEGETVVHLTPTTPSSVWERIVGLVPAPPRAPA